MVESRKPASRKSAAKPASRKSPAKPASRASATKPVSRKSPAKPASRASAAKPASRTSAAKPASRKPVSKASAAKPASRKPATRATAAKPVSRRAVGGFIPGLAPDFSNYNPDRADFDQANAYRAYVTARNYAQRERDAAQVASMWKQAGQKGLPSIVPGRVEQVTGDYIARKYPYATNMRGEPAATDRITEAWKRLHQ